MAARGIDHVVIVSDDLDALADRYRRLGFAVGRRNRHPWGTENHIVQFGGSFLELLGFAPDFIPLGPDHPAFPFTSYLADWSRGGRRGAAMMVLRSVDAGGDAKLFAENGIGEGRLLPFSRAAEGPDGQDRTVSFTVAFAALPGLPGVGAFTCQQHRPENFWNPDAQQHPNGALLIDRLVITTPDPEGSRQAVEAYAGASAEPVGDGRLDVPSPDGSLTLLTAEAARRDFGLDPVIGDTAGWIAALDIEVRNLAACRASLMAGGIKAQERGETLIVPASEAGGVALIYRNV